jgi:hypothetical protein
MSEQQPPPAGWGRPPPARPKTDAQPWYKRGWVIFLAGVLVGGIIGAASGGKSGSQATATSIVFRDREVPARPQPTSMPTAGRAGQTTTITKPKPTTAPAPTYGDGTYEVGSEIQPGTYRTSGGECYWERLKGFSGEFEDIIANGNISGPSRMTIRSSDKGVTFSGGCEWRKA